jgi:hypothetical protein
LARESSPGRIDGRSGLHEGVEENAMIEAIQDQWAIVAAVVVLVITAVVWAYARR